MFFDKAVFSQLFFDLAEIAFGSGNVQSVGDGFQMFDLRLCFRQLLNKRLFRPFQLAITVKVFFRVFRRRQSRIKRNRDLLVCIIVQCLKGTGSFFQAVTVSIDQFSIYFIFILFCRILHLFLLKRVFLSVPFKRSLDDPSKVRRFLANPVKGILRGIISVQHSGNRRKFLTVVFRAELSQRQNGIFHRFLPPVDDIRGKIALFYLLYQSLEGMIKMDAGGFIQRKSPVVSVNGGSVADFFRNQRAKSCQ